MLQHESSYEVRYNSYIYTSSGIRSPPERSGNCVWTLSSLYPLSHRGWIRWTLIFIGKCKRLFQLFPSLGQVFPLRDLMDKKCEFAPGSCACAHLVTLQQARTFKENYTLNCPFKNRFSCLLCGKTNLVVNTKTVYTKMTKKVFLSSLMLGTIHWCCLTNK